MHQTSCDLFENFSKQAQVWITALDGSPDAFNLILDQTNKFLHQWTSHGRSIHCAATLHSNRFLMVAGEIPQGHVSGCAIDALVHEIGLIVEDRQCTILSPMFMFYRESTGFVNYASRSQFREKLSQGLITPDTQVFNLGIPTLDHLSSGEFERSFADSVYTQIFQTPESLP